MCKTLSGKAMYSRMPTTVTSSSLSLFFEHCCLYCITIHHITIYPACFHFFRISLKGFFHYYVYIWYICVLGGGQRVWRMLLFAERTGERSWTGSKKAMNYLRSIWYPGWMCCVVECATVQIGKETEKERCRGASDPLSALWFQSVRKIQLVFG